MLIILKYASVTLSSNKYKNVHHFCSCHGPASCQNFTCIISLNFQGTDIVTLGLHVTKATTRQRSVVASSLIPVQCFPASYIFTTHLFHALELVLHFSVKHVVPVGIFFFTQEGVYWEKHSTAASGYVSLPP